MGIFITLLAHRDLPQETRKFPSDPCLVGQLLFEVSPLGALLFGVSDHGLAVFMMKSAALLCGFNPHCHPRTVHAGTF
jgi:hypothetical protein